MTAYEILSVVVTALGVLLLYQQLRLIRRQVADARESIDLSREAAEKENTRLARHATFDFVALTHAKMQEISGLLPPSGSSMEDIKTFLKKADERGSDEFVALRDYLNMVENLLVGVNMTVFDLDIIDRTSGARIMRAWNWYKDWIRCERTRTGQPTLWTELEEGASKIERRRLPQITTIQAPA